VRGFIYVFYWQFKLARGVTAKEDVENYDVPQIEDGLYAHFSFKFPSERIENVSLSLNNFINEKDAHIDFNNILVPSEAKVYPIDRNIDQLQVNMFDNIERTVFINKVLKEFEEDNIVFQPTEEGSVINAHNLFKEANKLEIYTEIGVYRYVLIGLLLNEPCDTFQYYENLRKSNNEFEKIIILDENLALMKGNKPK